MLTFLGILALVAAGAFIVWVVKLTIKALRDKIKQKVEAEKAKKVAVAHLKDLAKNSGNKVSLDELDKLCDEGYTDVIAGLDSSGEVIGDVEIVKDTKFFRDSGVKKLLGSEGMVVVEA